MTEWSDKMIETARNLLNHHLFTKGLQDHHVPGALSNYYQLSGSLIAG